MWFVVLFIISLFAYVSYRTTPQYHAKQLEQDSYNKKVKSFNEAKEQLGESKRLMSAYSRLIDIYSDEKKFGKNEKTKAVLEIMSHSRTTQVATAVCALAKIESNRRLNKNVTKS